MPLNVDKISTGSLSVNGTEINKNGGLPYKVYTALLTQSGGGNTTGISSGPLTKGVTYKIQVAGGDFSNVGAPNNDPDTYFVAINNDTPLSYGGNALLYNTGAPVVTVLENTIGDIVWGYQDVGQYSATLNGAFPLNKTGCLIGGTATQSNCPSFIASTPSPNNINAGNYIYVQCSGVEFTPNYYTDDALQNTMIEIRVYN